MPPSNAIPDNPLGLHAGPVNAAAARPSLPDNPLGLHNPAAVPDLTALATKIATSKSFDPSFVKQLQAHAKADPHFQNNLNAEISRVAAGIEAKQNSSVGAIVGQSIEGAVNPLEWVKGAIDAAPQVAHGVAKIVHGNLGGGAAETGLGALGIAGVLPFGRPAGAFAEGLRAGRTAEEAAQHVAEATTAARAAGHGIRSSQDLIPKLGPGETTAETGGELGVKVRDALAGRTGPMGPYEKTGAKLDNPTAGMNAAEARKVQAGLMSAERGARAAKLEQAFKLGGTKGHEAAMAALKGELPRIDFAGFKQFDQQTLDALHTHIAEHPAMRPYEKAAAQRTLTRAVDGIVPTKSGQTLLERAFGREAGQQIVQSVPFWQRAKRLGLDVLNVPRSIMASTDLSAPFRQGLVAGAAYPKIFFRNFNHMVRSFGSEDVYQGVMHGIYERPTFPLMQKAKLAITDIGEHAGGGGDLSAREEQFMSNLAEKIPGVGHAVRASDRAYVGFLNKTRADIFDQLVHQASLEGHNVGDEKTLKDIASFVNAATGRGDLKMLNAHTAAMNALFFSPRLLYSRLNFLNPVWYVRMDPFARQQALRAAVRLVGTLSTILGLAKMAGARVNTDPTNADFGKIRIGNTRIDLAAGFTQPIRLVAQLASGHVTSSTTGKILTLGPQGPGKLSRADIVQRFFMGKLAPVPSALWEIGQQKQFGGQKFSWAQEAESRFLPLLAQDAASLFQTQGGLPKGRGRIPAAAGLLGLDLFGVGVNSYAPKTPARGNGGTGLFGPGGGANPFGGSASTPSNLFGG